MPYEKTGLDITTPHRARHYDNKGLDIMTTQVWTL